MLTLDTADLERQQRISRFQEEQHRNLEMLWDNLERKTVTVAKDGDLVTTNLERQLGTPISSEEFMRRLGRMNPKLIFEPTLDNPLRIGIYIAERRINEAGDEVEDKMYVSAFDRGYLPERSVRHVKKSLQSDPDPRNKGGWIEVEEFQRETRGWRTVLVRLLRAKLIRMPEIDREFPPNWNSRNWQALTT